MGIKDKLKRTSRIFLSDSKEDVNEKKTDAKPEAEQGAEGDAAVGSASAGAEALASDGVNDAPTDNADGTLASSGDQEEGVTRDATQDVSEPAAHHAAPSAGDASGEQDAGNDAVKRTGSIKRIRNRARKPAADGEPKKSEFFSKLLKKFRRPVGPSGEKSGDVEAEKGEVKAAAPVVDADTSEGVEGVEEAVPKRSLDPATESATAEIAQVISEPAAEAAVEPIEPAEAAK